VTRVLLSRWGVYGIWNDPDPLITTPGLFVKYLWNLRRLRSLEIRIREDNYEQAKWVLEKLGGVKKLFGSLEAFFIDAETEALNIQELFQNKNLLSHLTDLRLSVPFDPTFAEIPLICKNLKSLALDFTQGVDEKPEFRSLLTSMQHLAQLKSLFFIWPDEARNFWGHFKPQSSLRQLTLTFAPFQLVNEGLFGGDTVPKDAVGHWEDIQELDVLKFHVSYEEGDETNFAKQFLTMILKKVRKVHTLRYWIAGSPMSDEPFFVEEVPHLYETLERFEHFLSNWSYEGPLKFDLKVMKPFRKLKEVNLDGCEIIYENVEEIVSLLEENQKEGVLKIQSSSMPDPGWLGETLKKIENIKKFDSDLEILIDLSFTTRYLLDLLEMFFQGIQAVKAIKGLAISLTIFGNDDFSPPVERIREILNKYSEIKNLELLLYSGNDVLRYRRLDGEKRQISISQFRKN